MKITDNPTTNETVKNGLGSTVRAVLGWFGAYLVSKKLLTADQSSALISTGTDAGVGILLAGGSLVWAWIQKHKKNVDVSKALTVSPSTTRATFEAIKSEVKQAS